MIRGAQQRITVPSVVAAFMYATATVVWLGVTGPAGNFAGLVPAYMVAVSIGSVFISGVANQVTWSRAWFAGPAYYYALHPSLFGWLAGTVAVGAATDMLDGLVARQLREESRFGGALDPVVDGLFYGSVGVGLWLSGLVTSWVALLVGLRYALPAAAGAVLLLGGKQPELRHTFFGQLSTVVIGISLGGVALLKATAHNPDLLVSLAYVAIPVTAVLTFVNLFVGRLRSARRVDSAWPR